MSWIFMYVGISPYFLMLINVRVRGFSRNVDVSNGVQNFETLPKIHFFIDFSECFKMSIELFSLF